MEKMKSKIERLEEDRDYYQTQLHEEKLNTRQLVKENAQLRGENINIIKTSSKIDAQNQILRKSQNLDVEISQEYNRLICQSE